MRVIKGVFYAGNTGRVERLLIDNELPCISIRRTIPSLDMSDIHIERYNLPTQKYIDGDVDIVIVIAGSTPMERLIVLRNLILGKHNALIDINRRDYCILCKNIDNLEG